MKPQFETTQLEAQPILGIRTTVSLSKIGRGMGALFGEVHGYIKQGGGQSAGRPLAIDHSSPGDTVDLECAIPVVSTMAGAGRVPADALPAGSAATVTHVGPRHPFADLGGADGVDAIAGPRRRGHALGCLRNRPEHRAEPVEVAHGHLLPRASIRLQVCRDDVVVDAQRPQPVRVRTEPPPSTQGGATRPFLAAVVAIACAVSASAQSIVVDMGGSRIGDYVVVSRSNDRSSVCDEYVNPNALRVPGCATPDRGVGDGWSAPFSGGGGLLAGADVEFDIAGPLKLAFDYSRVQAVFDQTVASTDAQGADFEKLSNELDVGQESLGTLRTHGVNGVLQLYPIRSGRIRPYGGIGLGFAAMSADFGWNWRRSTDPLAITTGQDQSNFDQIRRNLAGTASTGTALFRKNVHAFVYVAGVDFAVSDRFSVGVRARRIQYPSVEVGPYVGETLRGHVPNLRLDGSEPVAAWSTLPGTGVDQVSVLLKYDLRKRK